MCHICQNSNIFTVNAKQDGYDPTRTTVLRNMFVNRMNVRFNKFAREVRSEIESGNILREGRISLYQGTTPNRFPIDETKVTAFMQWLQLMIDRELLTVGNYPQLGRALHDRWTDMYIEDSYKRGVIRARMEMQKAGMKVDSIEKSGGIQAVMGTPFHMDRVGILFIRAFEELKGVTSQMSTQISRVLAEGMINGDNPRVIARKLNYVITGAGQDLGVTDSLGRFIPGKRRAQIIARTEIIRAHHRAMIQEYRNWGLAGVYVQAEFRTAGDERVCSECQSYHGELFSLDEAEDMIPVHPQCRCIVLPYEPIY